MNIPDHEFKEYHDYIKNQRDRYKSVLQDILIGVPSVRGMASSYRQLTLKEIQELCREVLN